VDLGNFVGNANFALRNRNRKTAQHRQRSMGMIKDVLGFSNIHAAKLPPAPADTDGAAKSV
jgi:hypothetical protein